MARGRWLPRCPTCGNEAGLRFVRSIDDKLRVYECARPVTILHSGGFKPDWTETKPCRTEFVCKLWTLHGEIEEMIAELHARVDSFRM